MARWLHWIVLLPAILFGTLVFGGTKRTNCGLLGPQFPKAHNLHQLQATTETVSTLDALISDALKNGNSRWGPLDRADSTFSIGVFTTSSNDFLYEYHHPGDNIKDTLTGGVLNKDTLYLIGSITKLLTIYTILVKLGPGYWIEPVTKFLPELANASKIDNSIVDNVDWSEVTLGSLASQMSGIYRDDGYFDTSRMSELRNLGFPSLENPSSCSGPREHACTWEESLKLIQEQMPITSTFGSPIYCNEAFQILGQAVERITSEKFEDTFVEQIVNPLGLQRTFWTPRKTDDNAEIISTDDPVTGYPFDYNMDTYSPTGSVACSLGDLSSIGRSILQSRLLSKATTREWLKPDTHTGMEFSAVGKPWEITRMEIPLDPESSSSTRLVDLYTKNGNIGAYDSYLILSPDHDLGITVFVASNLTRSSGLANQAIVTLSEMVTSVWITAAETAAREQAKKDFTGIYQSHHGETQAHVKLDLLPGRQGLTVSEMSFNGTDILSVLRDIMGFVGADLHYIGLEDARQVSFRAIWSRPLSQKNDSPVKDKSLRGLPTTILHRQCASTWGEIEILNYGNFGLDHFIFGTDKDGRVLTLKLPALRITLEKQASADVASPDPKTDEDLHRAEL